MSRSYVCKAEPPINPTKFWFCPEHDKAFIFRGTMRSEFFCDHLNKGTKVAGSTLETFHLEPRGKRDFAIYSETPFQDLQRLGTAAHFELPDMK
jgi:hypothetical protein